jgi:hypothetical protein
MTEQEFWKIVDIFNKEKNGYVKVCWHWIISLAFMNSGKTAEYLKLIREGDDYLKDASVLGIALSSKDKTSNKIIQELMFDNHPYVRESARLALGIMNMKSGNKKYSDAILSSLAKEDNSVVVTGSLLSIGMINYSLDDERIKSTIIGLMDKQEATTKWASYLALGLICAGTGKSIARVSSSNEFEKWGHLLGSKISGHTPKARSGCSQEVIDFTTGISQSLQKRKLNEFLFILPLLYYLLFDSFWWGLWIIGMAEFRKLG